MPNLPPTFGANRKRFEYRPSASDRGYDRDWTALRAVHFAAHPLCADCLDAGHVTAGEIVDHVEPINERPDRRLDPTNLRTLCRSHHTQKTNRDLRRQRSGQARTQAQE